MSRPVSLQVEMQGIVEFYSQMFVGSRNQNFRVFPQRLSTLIQKELDEIDVQRVS